MVILKNKANLFAFSVLRSADSVEWSKFRNVDGGDLAGGLVYSRLRQKAYEGYYGFFSRNCWL